MTTAGGSATRWRKSARGSKDIADDDLWMPSSKQALVDELVLAIHNREHGLLVGEERAPSRSPSCRSTSARLERVMATEG